MTTTETEFDLGNFPKEEEPENPYDDDVIKDLLGTIEVLEKRGWTGKGWSNGNRLCILNAASEATTGSPMFSYEHLSGKLLGYIHRSRHGGYASGAATPSDIDHVMTSDEKGFTMTRDRVAADIMRWNDGSDFKNRRPIISTLKKAIALRKMDLKKES